MQNKKKTSFINIKDYILLLLFVAISFVMIFTVFSRVLENYIRRSTEGYITENAEARAAVLETLMQDQLTMLESQARYFSDVDMSDYNSMKRTIMTTRGIGSFKNVGVADSSGATLNYKGESSGNIRLQKHFKDAMSGKSSVSDSIVLDEDGEEVLVLTVPIKKDEKAVGVVFGTFTRATLDSIIRSVSTDTDSVTIATDSSGMILAQSGIPEEKLGSPHIHDVIEGAENGTEKETAVRYFSGGGEDYIQVLVPIGSHGWYFSYIISRNRIRIQTSMITGYVGILVAAVTVVFAVVFLFIVRLIKNSRRILSSNERFIMAARRHNNTIFSYDPRTQTLKFDTSPTSITGEDRTDYSYRDLVSLFTKLHPEDLHVKNDLLDLRKRGKSVYETEFRLLTPEKKYYWFRLSISAVYDSHGELSQYVGSVENVDEEMNREIDLIYKASIDLLTNILNKGTFEDKCAHILEKADKSEKYALFVIDLDNFKSVNDTLGHAVGDDVLTDVASKLRSKFRRLETIGRIGGDEFAVLIRFEDDSEPKKHALDLIIALSASYGSGEKTVPVSASVGIACFPRHASDYETLFTAADMALYSVKHEGKNYFAVYSDE